MPQTIPQWARPHYEAGGGSAFLFYVVYGNIDHTVPLSATKYHVEEIPPDLEVMTYESPEHVDTLHRFQKGYLWEDLTKNHPSFSAQIASQTSCTILRGELGDRPTLDYLRDTVGLITHMLDHGGIAVYDPQMFHWWTPDEWREKIFNQAGPVPLHHTVILTSLNDDGPTEWIHTRGLRKFGRPDLSIPEVYPEWRTGAIDLCNRFITLQAFGGLVPEGQQVRLNTIPQELFCHHQGSLDDPDFNNVHISIH